jgi:hypothetical protein
MQMVHCTNCDQLTGFKRSLGFGTFFAVLLTAGFWLLVIPFYPVRCIKCGHTRGDVDATAKYIIAAAGVIVVVVVLWISHNVSENASTGNGERAPVIVVPPSDTTKSETQVQTQKNLPPAYMVGQQFSIGYWHYICNRAYWTPILASNPYSMERANADFVVVDLTIRNDDTSASTRPPFHLMDEKGRTYDESAVGMMSGGFFSVLETLNPGVSKRGQIAFDVPPDRQYFLIVSGGIESGKAAIVLLPMSSPAGQQAQSQTQ